jgi:hypothetical protein
VPTLCGESWLKSEIQPGLDWRTTNATHFSRFHLKYRAVYFEIPNGKFTITVVMPKVAQQPRSPQVDREKPQAKSVRIIFLTESRGAFTRLECTCSPIEMTILAKFVMRNSSYTTMHSIRPRRDDLTNCMDLQI